MKTLTLLCVVLLTACSFSSSNEGGEKNVGTPDTVRSAENGPDSFVMNQSNDSPSRKQESVVFDGTNYIKKKGWRVPSRKDTDINDPAEGRIEERRTEKGQKVRTTTIHYVFKNPWLYSQDFEFEGRDLDFIRGKLKSNYFLQESSNGKVFFYSIFGERVVPPPASNTDPHEDPFSYQIMDRDGDGIFETLLGDYDEIIVPNWVLK